MLLRTAPLLFSIARFGSAYGQEATGSPPDPLQSLRAEAHVARMLFAPTQPILVRFTLFNPTAETIEISVTRTEGEENTVSLPYSLVIGSSEQPALFVSYENDKPVAVHPEPRTSADGTPVVLRLAPRASIGAEVDLCQLHRPLRYSGSYRVEWHPLGGAIEPVTLAFRVESAKDAVLVTDYGKITFALTYEQAPHNVENFLELVRQRFYDGKALHRIISGFIIQGGSPDGKPDGVRPDGKLVGAEFHDAPFEPGTLAMARKPNDPDSASCQFFVSLARLPELDGKYTVIGQARDEESLRTLEQLAKLPANSQGRPLRPVPIRFLTLVDAASSTTRSAEPLRP